MGLEKPCEQPTIMRLSSATLAPDLVQSLCISLSLSLTVAAILHQTTTTTTSGYTHRPNALTSSDVCEFFNKQKTTKITAKK